MHIPLYESAALFKIPRNDVLFGRGVAARLRLQSLNLDERALDGFDKLRVAAALERLRDEDAPRLQMIDSSASSQSSMEREASLAAMPERFGAISDMTRSTRSSPTISAS